MGAYSKALDYLTKSLKANRETMVLRPHMQTLLLIITLLVVCITRWVNIARH